MKFLYLVCINNLNLKTVKKFRLYLLNIEKEDLVSIISFIKFVILLQV